MSNITVQRRGNETGAEMARRERDPLRPWRDIFRWDPFREMEPLWPAETATFIPSFDVKETKDAFVFKADVPGIKESDLEVSLTGSRLTISGKRESEKEEKDDTYYAYERSAGSFTRAFTLPEGIEAQNVAADLKEGVLTLVVPKSPAAVAKKIPVKTPGEKAKA